MTWTSRARLFQLGTRFVGLVPPSSRLDWAGMEAVPLPAPVFKRLNRARSIWVGPDTRGFEMEQHPPLANQQLGFRLHRRARSYLYSTFGVLFGTAAVAAFVVFSHDLRPRADLPSFICPSTKLCEVPGLTFNWKEPLLAEIGTPDPRISHTSWRFWDQSSNHHPRKCSSLNASPTNRCAYIRSTGAVSTKGDSSTGRCPRGRLRLG